MGETGWKEFEHKTIAPFDAKVTPSDGDIQTVMVALNVAYDAAMEQRITLHGHPTGGEIGAMSFKEVLDQSDRYIARPEIKMKNLAR